jgi:hypothetical protein
MGKPGGRAAARAPHLHRRTPTLSKATRYGALLASLTVPLRTTKPLVGSVQGAAKDSTRSCWHSRDSGGAPAPATATAAGADGAGAAGGGVAEGERWARRTPAVSGHGMSGWVERERGGPAQCRYTATYNQDRRCSRYR